MWREQKAFFGVGINLLADFGCWCYPAGLFKLRIVKIYCSIVEIWCNYELSWFLSLGVTDKHHNSIVTRTDSNTTLDQSLTWVIVLWQEIFEFLD